MQTLTGLWWHARSLVRFGRRCIDPLFKCVAGVAAVVGALTLIRDHGPSAWGDKYRLLHFLPGWSWEVWLIVILVVILVAFAEGAFRIHEQGIRKTSKSLVGPDSHPLHPPPATKLTKMLAVLVVVVILGAGIRDRLHSEEPIQKPTQTVNDGSKQPTDFEKTQLVHDIARQWLLSHPNEVAAVNSLQYATGEEIEWINSELKRGGAKFLLVTSSPPLTLFRADHNSLIDLGGGTITVKGRIPQIGLAEHGSKISVGKNFKFNAIDLYKLP